MIKPLKHFLFSLIPEHHVWKFELFKKWETIIGPSLKDKVFIEKIDKGILYLVASHPVWAQELLLLSPFLKKQINAHVSGEKIIAIKFRASQTARPVHHTAKNISPQQMHRVPQKLNSHEYKLLASLPSTELQSAIAAYFIRCKTLQKEKE
jgi:hypothetical protein